MDPTWSGTTSGLGSSSGQQTVRSSVSGSTNPQEWCLHAQLTIRHPAAGRMVVKPTTAVVTARENAGRDECTREGNVRFECSWENSGESVVTEVVPIEQGIQKFESWLPSTPVNEFAQSPTKGTAGTAKAGNNNGGPKARTIQPYSRRCKSTCSITLTNSNSGTATVAVENKCDDVNSSEEASGRASSLPPEKPASRDAETQTAHRDKSSSSISRVPSTKIKRSGAAATTLPSHGIIPSIRNQESDLSSVVSRIRKNNVTEVEPREVDKRWKNSSPASTTERPSRRTHRSSSPSSKLRAKSSPSVRQQQK